MDFSARQATSTQQQYGYTGVAESTAKTIAIGAVVTKVEVKNFENINGTAPDLIVNFGNGADVTITPESTHTYDGVAISSIKVRTASGMASFTATATRTIQASQTSYVQKTKAMAAASDTAVHAAVTLDATNPTQVTDAITQPDDYRCLRVKGNQASVAGTVTIEGTNWQDEYISEAFTLNGASAVEGVKPFKTVTRVIMPKRAAAGDTVSVGWNDKIGLHKAIAASGDVVEVGRKASAATEFTLEAVVTVNTTYGTVLQGSAIVASDRFELTYRTRA